MAVFVPDPDLTLDDLVEDLSRELADRYRDAEDTLIREVAVRAARDLELAGQLPTDVTSGGLTVVERRRQNRILAELAEHRARSIRELQGIAVAMVEALRKQDLAARVVAAATREGEAAAAAELGLAARQVPAGVPVPFLGGPAGVSVTTLSGTAAQATGMVALSLQSRLDVLNQRLTRYPQDAYQRVVAVFSPQTILGAQTSRVQQAATVQRFLAEGITGFVDRSGRRWTIGAYAEMAGRTTVARAFNDAGVWRMGQSGISLVTISGGADACKRCAPWIGKVLSTDGRTGTVELRSAVSGEPVSVTIAGTLDQARNAGWGHPNDRCKVSAYLPGLAVPQNGFQYDERADMERQRQRELERDVRAARRREASALSDTDRRKAAREVADAQAALREFARVTGRPRQYYREQLRFADG